MPSVDELLTLGEAADRSDVSASRLRRLAKAGTLRARRVGRDWVVTRSDLEAFMGMERPRGVSAAARARRVQGQEGHDS